MPNVGSTWPVLELMIPPLTSWVGQYAMASRISPSLAGSYASRTLNRHTLGIVIKPQTGRGYFGEYYQTRNIQEPVACPYGAKLQTREHIGFECQTCEEYWSISDSETPDHQLATLFGTKECTDSLAEFFKKSKVFQNKKPKRSRRNFQLQNRAIRGPDEGRRAVTLPLSPHPIRPTQ